MFTLLFLSGGTGSRMLNAVPKQYMLLAGKPVVMHILERVDQLPEIAEVVMVCAKEYEPAIALMLNQYGVRTPVRFAPAGSTRQESVRNGLAMVATDNVIVHEAARPFVKVEDFQRLMEANEPNAMLGEAIPFSVLVGHEYVEGALERSSLVNVQLPQKFQTQLLREVHEKAMADGATFTEDAAMLHKYHPEVPIKICPGMPYNLKLTTRIDMLVGEQIYDEVFRKRK